MKRRISLFLTLITVLCLLCAVSLPAVAEGETMIIGSDEIAKPGEEVGVKVKLVNNPGFFAIILKINYPGDTFEYNGYEEGVFSKLSLDVQNVKNGYIGIVGLANSSNINGDGELFTLKFKVRENASAAKYKITLNCLKGDMCNYNEEDIVPVVFSPTVTVPCKEHKFSDTQTKSENGQTFLVCENCGALKTNSDKVIADVFKTAENDLVNTDGTVTKEGVSEEETAGLGTSINSEEVINSDKENESVRSPESQPGKQNAVLIIIIISATVLLLIAGYIIFKTVKRKE